MKFKQYLVQEGFFSKLKKLFFSLISKLKFGQTKTIKLKSYFDANKITMTEAFDSGARALLGFYSEMICAIELRNLLLKENINVLDNTIENDSNTYLNTKLKGRISDKDIHITELKGKEIAKQMFTDIISSNDIVLIEYFDILRTGVPGVRADITINIKKRDEESVITLIEASLKSLSSNSLTIYSSTALGFLWKVAMGKTGSSDKSKFSDELVETISSCETAYKEKDEASLTLNRSKLTSLFVEEVNKYSKDKAFIERIKESTELNMDAMDVYIAIGKSEKIKTISSKNSKNFEKLLKSVNSKLYIKAEKTSNLGFTIFMISEKTNTPIISFKCGWGVTSSKTGTQKLNIMGSAKNFE